MHAVRLLQRLLQPHDLADVNQAAQVGGHEAVPAQVEGPTGLVLLVRSYAIYQLSVLSLHVLKLGEQELLAVRVTQLQRSPTLDRGFVPAVVRRVVHLAVERQSLSQPERLAEVVAHRHQRVWVLQVFFKPSPLFFVVVQLDQPLRQLDAAGHQLLEVQALLGYKHWRPSTRPLLVRDLAVDVPAHAVLLLLSLLSWVSVNKHRL